MENSFEPFHVPQQSRRHKLRVTLQNNEPVVTDAYTPSLFTPTMLTSSNPNNNNSNTNQFLCATQAMNQSFNGTGDKGLHLSLSSHQYRQLCLPLQVSLRRQDGVVSGPLGPFTGYASILNRSRFLKPAQQLLDDFCSVGCGVVMGSPLESLNVVEAAIVKDLIACSDVIEHRWKNSTLVLLLEEVYRRYKLYCQQMQSVISSFETVSGLGNAAPYISFAFKTLSKHFSCLKNAIVDQIHFTGQTLGCGGLKKDQTSRLSTADQGFQNQKQIQGSAFLQHPVWRSQRGLPDRAVAVLRMWLFEHFLHPYPSDSDKQMLARETGLSRSQVSNWFINARVRVWKPMVEEIHKLETREAQISLKAENRDASMPTDYVALANPLPSEKQFANMCTNETLGIQSKRSRSELFQISEQIEEQMKICYNNLSSNFTHLIGGSKTGGSIGVSLALGLQNDGIELSQPLPMNVAHHFDMETGNGVYLKHDFGAEYQHLRKY